MLAGPHVLAVSLLAAAVPPPPSSVAELGRGHAAFRQGDYGAAIRPLQASLQHGLLNRDYALYLLAESEFYDGRSGPARGHFEALAQMRRSRFAALAPWRAADCLWAEGRHAAAGAAYARLLKRDQRAGDAALARFRIAALAATDRPAEARRLFLALYADAPAHPLADEALRRAAKLLGAAPAALDKGVDTRERLKRAATFSEGRHWQEALDELDKLGDVPEELQVERDYQIGMTKFRMRRDYGRAAELLLAASPRLVGERAASAAFHGARALSRADQDDQAIRAYGEVVRRFPRSRWAAEAQFLSGWLDFNRGRYRDGLEALRATVERYPRSPFADDAAWYLAFAHYLLGEWDLSLAALDRYARLASADGARVRYWRARVLAQLGRENDARAILREVAHRWPLGYYGLAARARLAAAGEPAPAALPHKEVALPPVAGALARDAARDPTVARADELLAAGLDVEGGRELERGEDAVLRHLGKGRGLSVLLDRYRAMKAFRRAYQLAEARAAGALAAEPAGSARRLWEAAYPRAYEELVERYGPKAGNPDHLLYAIMRKESGFEPHDVSYADARGLLQMIPPTSARVAAAAGSEFHSDELFEPETNIRLGAAYIGSLFRAFGGQVPLVAGAYNAGPRAMTRWCGQHGGRPLDEFVELIAYSQTREYVKRVAAIYARYRRLYGSSPYELPLAVDAKVAEDRPDF